MSVFELSQLLSWTGMDYIVSPHKRIYWLFILTSLFMALLFIFYKKQKISNYLQASFWLHPSAKLDYGYFLLISLLKVLFIFPLMLGVGEVALFVLQKLTYLFGYQSAINLSREVIVLCYTLVLFVSGDFTRYWLHRWLHSNRVLWQFHKVHHSAQVLTPITFYRVHPVENILFGLRYSLVTGLVTGVFIYFFGARLEVLDVLGVNLFIFISLLLGANLRHSPIALAYPKIIEKWLISPAQHQYHHTTQGSRKNYAGVLALWDRLFGTLQHSNNNKVSNFGLPVSELAKNEQAYQSLTGLIFSPFLNIQHIINNVFSKWRRNEQANS